MRRLRWDQGWVWGQRVTGPGLGPGAATIAYWVAVWWPLAPLRCTAASVQPPQWRPPAPAHHHHPHPVLIWTLCSHTAAAACVMILRHFCFLWRGVLHWCYSGQCVLVRGHWPVYIASIATHCHAEQSASVQRPLATPPLSHHILAGPGPRPCVMKTIHCNFCKLSNKGNQWNKKCKPIYSQWQPNSIDNDVLGTEYTFLQSIGRHLSSALIYVCTQCGSCHMLVCPHVSSSHDEV